jgi:hypothetical protein
MLAISTQIIGAAAPGFGDPAIVQPDRNPVGRKLAALHFRRQSIAAPDEIGDRTVVKVAPAAREGLGRGKCADRPFRDRSLDHSSMRASKSHAVHGRPCLRVRLEQVPKQPLGLFQSFVRQHHGFGAPHCVRGPAFLVQSLHRSPVERVPNALSIVPTQEQEHEHAVVDAVGNECHLRTSGSCR